MIPDDAVLFIFLFYVFVKIYLLLDYLRYLLYEPLFDAVVVVDNDDEEDRRGGEGGGTDGRQ